MTYENIIKFLKENKINTSAAFVATSCDAAWDVYGNEIQEKHPDMTFNEFCNIADDMWNDCEDSTGLTVIADWVADWLINHDEAPDNFCELFTEYGY